MDLYEVKIEDRAFDEIQDAILYYEGKQSGLGLRFKETVLSAIESLKRNPFYQVRYSTFRCLPIKKFPYMIHFEVDENAKRVDVFAVINTYLNPQDYWLQ